MHKLNLTYLSFGLLLKFNDKFHCAYAHQSFFFVLLCATKKKIFYTTPKEFISASEALSKGLLVHNMIPPTAATPQATEFTTPRKCRTSPTSVQQMRNSNTAKRRYHFGLHVVLETFLIVAIKKRELPLSMYSRNASKAKKNRVP